MKKIHFKATRKKVLSIIVSLLAITLTVWLLSKATSQAAEAPWSENHNSWSKRQRITLTNTSSNSLASGTTISVTINTRELVLLGQLQADCDDIRILYQPDSTTFTELTRSVSYSNNDTCVASEATNVFFQLQAALGASSSSTNYYIYYGNQSVAAPSATEVDVFNQGAVNALLSCELRGTTNCINNDGAEFATTSSGAVRSVALKSGLFYDGVNDYITAADSTSLSITGDITVEAWVKGKQLNTEQTIIGKWDETTANDDRSYRLYATSGNKFAFSISTDGTAAEVTTTTGSTTTIEKATWYHVAGVYDANAETLDLFVNGVKDNTQVGSAGAAIDNNNSQFYVGGKENTSGSVDTFFLGIIDEVRISDTIRYTSSFTPITSRYVLDGNTRALYHFDEGGETPWVAGSTLDETDNNHATITGAVYAAGFVGYDGPSEFGAHSGNNNVATLVDANASWVSGEWTGYILFNSTDASHGIVTANTTNTITATLAGGSENDWDTGDLFTLSPDLGKPTSQRFAGRYGTFLEEATTNKITNPSFENTTYDTSWAEGTGTGAVIAVTRTTASTSGGTQDITNSNLGGNTPKAVIIIGSYATTDGTARDHVASSYGAATGTSNEWYVSTKVEHNVATDDTDSGSGTDATVLIPDPLEGTGGLGNLGKAEFSTFITNGVRINWTTTPTTAFYLTVVLIAGSSVNAHANSLALGTTTGGVVTNAVGFEADMVFTANQVGVNVPMNGAYGIARNNGAGGVTQRGLFTRYGGIIPYQALTRTSDAFVGGQLNGAGAISWSVALGSFDSDGFTATVATAGSGSTSLRYLALDYGSSTGSWVGTNTTPTSTGNDAETGPGFTPQFVFQLMHFGQAINTTYTDANAGGYGFSTFDANDEYANSFSYQDNANPSNSQSLSDDLAVNQPTDTGAAGVAGSFVSFDQGAGWTTNYTSVTAAGKLFFAAAVEAPLFLTRTIETSAPFVKFGSRATKIVASGSDTSLVHNTNPGNTNTHTLSFYVYRGTSGNIGGSIDNTMAQALFDGVSQAATAYEDVGGGWWRLTYTDNTSNAATDYGIWIADGETLYVDGFQLEEKVYATTYTDGSLGTGYSWSAAINSSSSSRALANVDYAASGNIQASAGSVSFWLKPLWDGDDGAEHTFLDVDASAEELKLYKTTGDVLTLTDGTNIATADTSGWTKNEWHYIVATWGSGDMQVYVDTTVGSAAGAFSAPTITTSIYIGQSNTHTASANAVMGNLRIYDAALTPAQITDIYNSDLVSLQLATQVDAFSNTRGANPTSIWHFDEGSGTTAHDSSINLNHLTMSGTTWDTLSDGSTGLRSRNMRFDGSNDFLYQESDADFNPGTEDFTIAGWFRHPSTVSGTNTILARFGTAGYKVYMNSSGNICFGIDDDSLWDTTDIVCSTTNLADSKWHHFITIRRATAITIFIDNIQAGQDTSLAETGSLNTDSRLYIGIDSDGSSSPWEGFLDEIAYYPYALSTTQIQASYFNSQTAVIFGGSQGDYLSQGLVGYWKMDENTDTNAADSSGNNNAGTLTNGPTWSPGKYGSSVLFDGDDDVIDAGSGSSLDDLSAMTIAGWVYRETTGNQNIASKESTNAPTNGWYFSAGNSNPAQVTFTVDYDGTNLTRVSSAVLPNSAWNHVAVSWDGSTTAANAKIYINGVETTYSTTTDASGTRQSDAGQDLRIGDEPGGSRSWDGNIDELRIYNRNLSTSEVASLYSWAPGPVGYWKLDDNIGTSAADTSGNSNFGTLNAPTWIPGKYGSALKFDGADDVVTVTDADILDFGTKDFTISTWVYGNSMANSDIVLGKSNGGACSSTYGFLWGIFDSLHPTLYFCSTTGDHAKIQGTTTLADGQWNHITVVVDRDSDVNTKVYVNGVAVATTIANLATHTGSIANAVNLVLGAESDGGFNWDGSIDDVKVYDYVRTSKQIVEDMNAGHPAGGSPIASQILYWKLDELQGSTANNSGFGSSMNGTVANTVWLPANNCKLNGCLNVNDAADSVSAGDVAFTDSLTAMTVSIWVNPQSLDTLDTIVSKSDVTAANHAFQIATHNSNSDELIVQIGDGSDLTDTYITSNFDLSTSTWTHLTMVYDGTLPATERIKVYKNGRIISGSYTGTIPSSMLSSSTANLKLGDSDSAGTSGLVAYLDEFKIYTSALTPAEVMIDMNAGAAAALGGVLGNQSNEDFGGNPPVGWWTLNDNTGTTSVIDTSGNENTLTMNNFESNDWVPGKQGSALKFDGSDETLSRTDDADFDFGTGNFSIMAWVKHNGAISSSEDYIITKADTTNGGYKLYMDPSGDFCFAIDDDATWTPDDTACTSGIDFDDGAWHHVAGVRSSLNNIRLYVDGRLVNIDGSLTANGTLSNGNALYIGVDRDGSTGAWDGLIDDIRIYNYGLTQNQVNGVYNRGAPFAWYRLDECTGTTAYNSAINSNGTTMGLHGTISAGSGGSNTSVGSCSTGVTTQMWNNGTIGKYNGSLDFDGNTTSANTDRVDMGDQSQFNIGASESFSVEAWVNRETFNTLDTIVSKKADLTAGTGNGWILYVTINDFAVFNVGDGTGGNSVSSSQVITSAGWNHIVGVHDKEANTINVYVNGQLTAGTSASANFANPSVSMRIGMEADDAGDPNAFDGQIDNVKLYSYPLSPTQVRKAYNEGAAVRFGPATGYP